jgi:hypothetical protein
MAFKKKINKGAILEDGPVVESSVATEIKEENENTVAEGLKQTKNRYPGNWIKATPSEIQQYQDEGRLFGHDPDTDEVLIDVNKK